MSVAVVFAGIDGMMTLPRTLWRHATGYYDRLPAARLRRAAEQALREHVALSSLAPRLRVNAWNWADPPTRLNRHRPAVAALWLQVRDEDTASQAEVHLAKYAELLRAQIVAGGLDPEDAALVQVGCVTSGEIERIGGPFGFDRELWPLSPTGRIDLSAAP